MLSENVLLYIFHIVLGVDSQNVNNNGYHLIYFVHIIFTVIRLHCRLCLRKEHAYNGIVDLWLSGCVVGEFVSVYKCMHSHTQFYGDNADG